MLHIIISLYLSAETDFAHWLEWCFRWFMMSKISNFMPQRNDSFGLFVSDIQGTVIWLVLRQWYKILLCSCYWNPTFNGIHICSRFAPSNAISKREHCWGTVLKQWIPPEQRENVFTCVQCLNQVCTRAPAPCPNSGAGRWKKRMFTFVPNELY